MAKKTRKTVAIGKITKKMTFAEVLQKYPETAEVFINEGMHCVGCPAAGMETIEQGCKAHGLKPEKIVEKINKKLEKKK
jgi:hybrid cluster-associated redox disulfide protein